MGIWHHCVSVISLHWSTWSKDWIQNQIPDTQVENKRGICSTKQGRWAAKLTELHPCLTPSNLAAPQLTLHDSAVHQYHLPLQFPAVTLPVIIVLFFCILIHSVILDLLALHLIICVTVSFSGASFYMKVCHLKICFKKHLWNNKVYCMTFRH